MAPESPDVVHLNELSAIPGPGSLTWSPVRLTLGVRAFGCNPYTAGEPGQDVVEPHTEDPKLAHQELYFDPERARRILSEGLETYPESASPHYNLACLEAIQGHSDAALASLRRAVELAPDAARWARDDEDLASLRDDPEFRALVALT
jgi:tetratricopeptide (TPR) repeat protein